MLKNVKIVENYSLKEAMLSGEKKDSVVEAVLLKPDLPSNVKEMLKEDNVAVIRVIQSGWSFNKNYYTTERLQELPSILTGQANVQFLDHQTEDGVNVLDRSVNELVSYSRYVWYDSATESVYAAVYFPKSKVDTSWIYEVMDVNPENIGLSISSYVDVQEDYEQEGIKGNLITGWLFFESVDYVLFPSAGGGGITTKESKQIIAMAKESATKLSEITKGELIKDAKALHEAITLSVQNYVNDHIHRDYFYTVLDALYDIFWYILYTDDVQPEERDKTIKDAFAEAYDVLSKLDYVNNQTQSKENNQMKEIKSLEDLRSQYPDLVKSLVEEALKDSASANLQEQLDQSKDEVSQLSTKLVEADEKVKTATAENAELKEKVSKYEAEEAKAARKEAVDGFLEQYKVPQVIITERFRATLMDLPEDQVEEEIKDRMRSIESYKTNGSTTVHTSEDEGKESDEDVSLKEASEGLVASLNN